MLTQGGSKMMIDNETRERLSKYILKTGEFVIARRGDLSKCAIVSKNELNELYNKKK